MDAGNGEDRISSLPNEVLHAILISLSSPRAAVRTGVLSHRWRHVWTPLRELRLAEGVNAPLPQPLASFLDTVDAAWDTPTLKGLSIEPSAAYGRDFPARRVAPWLSFASERVVGPLFLRLPMPEDDGEEAVLELLACEGLGGGLLRALTDLTMICDCMDGSELTTLVCTQCLCLMDLRLCIRLDNAF
uniref:F-box domain-containing protein n=1 Tax=Setaria viridis TaxID=4556 RepID=A0A4U6TGG0_SETVI|nr:hypothetical protein SEVIR_8G174400v2 [Setaria viridis]